MLALTRAHWLSVFRFMVVTGLVALPQASASPDDPGKTSKAPSGATAATISGRVTDQAGVPLADVRVTVVAVRDPETRRIDAGAGPDSFSPGPTPGGTIGSTFPLPRSARSS